MCCVWHLKSSCHIFSNTPYSFLYLVRNVFGCHDINGLFNEQGPHSKKVTVSMFSHFVRTESPQGFSSLTLTSPTSIHRVLSSLNWSKEKKMDILKYVDMYIHTSFLNSQSTPWSEASCRQSGKAEKNSQKSPESVPLASLHTECVCNLPAALSPSSFVLFPHQVTCSVPSLMP